MLSPTFVKVPEGIVKKSNQLGLLNELVFFYKLKSMKIEGEFTIQEIAFSLNLSNSYIYKMVSRLKGLNWIKQDKEDKIRLIKYDNLFEYFKYDLKLKVTENIIRKGNFKIFKISTKFINDLISIIAYHEIKFNLQKQKYTANKKSLMQKKATLDASINIKGKDVKRVNWDITLSARGISRIMGFSSSSMGFKIQQKLEELKFIHIQRRYVLSYWNLRNLITPLL